MAAALRPSLWIKRLRIRRDSGSICYLRKIVRNQTVHSNAGVLEGLLDRLAEPCRCKKGVMITI